MFVFKENEMQTCKSLEDLPGQYEDIKRVVNKLLNTLQRGLTWDHSANAAVWQNLKDNTKELKNATAVFGDALIYIRDRVALMYEDYGTDQEMLCIQDTKDKDMDLPKGLLTSVEASRQALKPFLFGANTVGEYTLGTGNVEISRLIKSIEDSLMDLYLAAQQNDDDLLHMKLAQIGG